ncbi:hypothetical protein HID58_051922 [Brassica napus]|uniref:Leucine-rich repeat-containing N-terminal plant-type domain-containing protein n=1 Tax=Brassica napus TaxID=3708 RepID=A0ABQ8AB81_BRANA|nr:hypothetical protein HID58_051922 [Brassica napus]
MDLMLKLRPSFFFSFLIFIFLLQKPNLGSASSPKCISTERQALLTFKQSLTDPSGRLSSWSRPDCCKWRGVCCDRRTSYVIKIDLRNPNQTLRRNGEFRNGSLGGKIHPSLTRLKFLSYLDLSSNDFNFTEIPEFVGHIVSLRYLNLSFSSFSGEVPASFGNLSKLESLDLYAQTLPLSLPSSANLKLLEVLDLSRNYFYSPTPNWLFDLTSLRKLFLQLVRLQGSISPGFKKLKLLETLDLSKNELSGEIPAVLGDLPRLKNLHILDLSENKLSGSVPKCMGNLTAITLDLSRNRFSGAIPQSLAAISSLHTLNVSYNKLEGSIPKQLKFKDPSIYAGNELLCGKPLSKKCARKQQDVVVN